MEHFANGGEVEYHDNNLGWLPATTPVWDWAHQEYRIKPDEPKFKVGDRVIVTKGAYIHSTAGIKEINENLYIFESSIVSNTKGVINYWSIKHQDYLKLIEPKFKVGDWVRFTDTPTQIEQYNGKPYHAAVKVELWEPQLNEWCWFYSGSEPGRYILSKFKGIRKLEAVCGYNYPYETVDGGWFEKCFPFIETLPAHLKDAK